MTLLHQAAQKAVEALRQVTTSETFYRDPRGDRAGPAIDALVSALQQQPEPVAEDDPTHWKQNYFNLRHVMQDWHAQALTARFDGVPDVLLVAAEAANLFSALNAMLTQFGMDEDEWSRPTFKQAKSAIEQYLAARKKTADAPALQHQEEPCGNTPYDEGPFTIATDGGQEEPREPVALERWGRTKRNGSVSLERMADGYWTPWHIAQEALAASPSTTRQQEVGSFDEWVAREWPNATDGERDVAWSAWHAAAPSTPEKAGGVPARLWAMHIAGPDDVHAAPGEAEARAAAERFNEWFAQRKDPHPLDPQMHATAIEWPHSAEAHANDLPRWRDFVLPAAGVEGKCECGLSEVACRDPLRRSCPDGMSASVSHPLPAQANDGGEHG